MIKEIRSGKLKGRTCADGRPQRCYITKEYTSLLTIYLEYFITNLIIDAHEGIDVEVFDVPGAYLNADMPEDKFIILNIEGEFVDIMCEVNPEHKKTLLVENSAALHSFQHTKKTKIGFAIPLDPTYLWKE